MTQQFKLTFPAPGTSAAEGGSHIIARIARAGVLVATVVLLVALLGAAELSLTPGQRLDLLEATTGGFL